MKTFSRLSLFTLVCLGLALMLVGSTADVHAQEKEVTLSVTGADTKYPVGEKFTIIFTADIDGVKQSGANLTIKPSKNVNVTSGLGATTGVLGTATVTAIGTAQGKGSIQATWVSPSGITAKGGLAEFDIIEIGKHPALIVVNPLSNESELKIGDTFTQMITIENRDEEVPLYSTLPLSAWQMDVVYNPMILEVVGVEEGDFLESDGVDARFVAMQSKGKISVSQARAGQMKNTEPPPKPDMVAHSPSPAGIALAPGDKGTLLTITFKLLAVAEEALGIHNVRLQSDQDDNEDGTLDRISYSILVTDVAVATHQSPKEVDIDKDGDLDEMDELNPVDVNQDLSVDILDLVEVASSIGMVPGNPRADVNDDGFVNVLDLISIYKSPLWAKSVDPVKVNDVNESALMAPSVSRNVGPDAIQSWIDLARIEDDGSAIFDLGIANLEALLASRIPTETRLLLNYPNPFNPETWIPYQLAEATKVTVTIHAMNGSLIRTLELGHQSAGTYKSKSQAAYWDGRNEFGEQVASGLYFYTLTAGDFSATHKMLVRK